MSLTRSSPSCESRRRDTASYSYRPCWALVVDLICHCNSGMPSAAATSSASIVLPVPGSPLISNGRFSVIAALTASLRSSVATYCDEPSKRMTRPSEKEKLQYKSEGFLQSRPRERPIVLNGVVAAEGEPDVHRTDCRSFPGPQAPRPCAMGPTPLRPVD